MQRQKYSIELKPLKKASQSLSLNHNSAHSKSSLHHRIGLNQVPQTTKTTESTPRINILSRKYLNSKVETYSTDKISKNKITQFKLPKLAHFGNNILNPQQSFPYKLQSTKKIQSLIKNQPLQYYQPLVYKSLKSVKSHNYMFSVVQNHFLHTVQALKTTKHIKIPLGPHDFLKLNKKNPNFKTVFLDLDQTLIHCDQNSTSYTVKLDFPCQNGTTISAGIRLRPHCKEFLEELSKAVEIIIFTASSQSYADVILNYLDPWNKIFSHRLYRHHCKQYKNYFVKDLRIVNRRLEDSIIIDNSAYSFIFQPFNAVPVLPFYHYGKDKELKALLPFIKFIIKQNDVRIPIKKVFFWHKYLQNDNDPVEIFKNFYQQTFQTD